MRSFTLAALIFAVGIVVTVPAQAAFETLFEVYQPLLIEEGIVIASVPSVIYVTGRGNAAEVFMTCSKNQVRHESEVGNLNIASLLGLRFAGYVNPADQDGLFGDTLVVTLDASAADTLDRFMGTRADSVVVATFECVLANCKRSSPANYLRFSVIGARRFGYLDGTYKLVAYPVLPRRRYFDN